VKSANKYIPNKQDIVIIDFSPSSGKEINKRRPAVVVSSQKYSTITGFVAVCPITHGANHLKEKGLLVEVQSQSVDGFVNPFQLHTFDYISRNTQKVGVMDTAIFQKVVQLNQFIFN